SSITKEMINKNPVELITQCVLVESKTMLKSTSLSIQQISDALNFPNQSFFGKYFKRYSGMSPQQYRQS
ncbi:MAG: helix-turn-helix domain-containing protein, partial [Parabacteroides sp.]|nr:helix-turn-helix domain-containing protein [Parabacteroides sp.]